MHGAQRRCAGCSQRPNRSAMPTRNNKACVQGDFRERIYLLGNKGRTNGFPRYPGCRITARSMLPQAGVQIGDRAEIQERLAECSELCTVEDLDLFEARLRQRTAAPGEQAQNQVDQIERLTRIGRAVTLRCQGTRIGAAQHRTDQSQHDSGLRSSVFLQSAEDPVAVAIYRLSIYD